jgi:erythronate-4-phosphate dehydrogenase
VKTVCAASVLWGREAFGGLGEIVVLPDDRITPDDVRGADALIVRSKTRVDKTLLGGSSVSFVGTATAGFDHLDTSWLDAAGMAWCAASGCNANSVSEYVTAALLHLANRGGFELAGRTLGVIGVGQVGGRVATKAEGLGMRVLRNDPPLQRTTSDPAFLPLHEVLGRSEAVTLHVPLARSGPFPTHHLAGCDFFGHLRPGAWFLNTSRGEVMDSDGLQLALGRGAVGRAVLDVWENEPDISPGLLEKTALATPHIAGYSYDGRMNGTLAVYREACRFFEMPVVWSPCARDMPPGESRDVDARGRSDEEVLHALVRSVYDIESDDAALRGSSMDETMAGRFRRLRHAYPARREFPAFTVSIAHGSEELVGKVAALGFKIRPPEPAW